MGGAGAHCPHPHPRVRAGARTRARAHAHMCVWVVSLYSVSRNPLILFGYTTIQSSLQALYISGKQYTGWARGLGVVGMSQLCIDLRKSATGGGLWLTTAAAYRWRGALGGETRAPAGLPETAYSAGPVLGAGVVKPDEELLELI